MQWQWVKRLTHFEEAVERTMRTWWLEWDCVHCLGSRKWSLCQNMSWSFSSKTMYFSSTPTLDGHQSTRVMNKMKNAPFLFQREMTIRQYLKVRAEETTVWVDKSAKTDVVLFLTIDAYLCSIKREKDISFTATMILVMDHEWPLIEIHLNKTKI